MQVYRRDTSGQLSESRSNKPVSLADVYTEVVRGNQIQVLDRRSNEDVTQSTLLDIFLYQTDRDSRRRNLNRELEALIRQHAEPDEANGKDLNNVLFDESTLATWMKFTADYGRDWFGVFGRTFYSWEYALLIAKVVELHWQNQPIEIETVMNLMRKGSRKTRLARVKNLISEGWLISTRQMDDRRRTAIRPTHMLQTLVRAHLAQTLASAITTLKTVVEFEKDVNWLVEVLTTKNDGSIDRTHLQPWAQLITQFAYDWVDDFGAEFPKLEYVNIFTQVVLAYWRDDPPTFSQLSEHLRTGSPRTHKSQLSRAIELDFIRREHHASDKRFSIYLPTERLVNQMRTHCSHSLRKFVSLVDGLPIR